MSILAVDNFNRADENPIQTPWAANILNGMTVTSNALVGAANNAGCATYHLGVTWPDDHASSFRVAAVGSRDGGPAVRCSGDDSTFQCYFATAETGTVQLYAVTAGSTFTLLGTGTGTYSADDVLKVEAQGTNIRVLRNGVQIISANDSAIASGSPGAFIWTNDLVLDNFEGSDFIGGRIRPARGMTAGMQSMAGGMNG